MHKVTYDADSTIVSCSCGKSIRVEFIAEPEREAEAERWSEWHKGKEEDA